MVGTVKGSYRIPVIWSDARSLAGRIVFEGRYAGMDFVYYAWIPWMCCLGTKFLQAPTPLYVLIVHVICRIIIEFSVI